uniref:HAT C-terminal dimerisation domain-containing protein n=1 Tax=Sinocyclocheilus rhinocerous TaxID=307959 RepID=A0A673IJH3_9TELE
PRCLVTTAQDIAMHFYLDKMHPFFKRKKAEDSETPSTSKAAKCKQRKYNPDYIKYGFTASDEKPQCVECGEVLAKESMKPSKLERHLQTKHPTCVGKPVDYFVRKRDLLKRQQSSIVSLTTASKSTLKASYLAAGYIARAKKLFNIGEELVIPCAVDMCREVLGESAANKIKEIPLSNDTVSRRIIDMSDDIETQLLDRVRASPLFAIQIDESTDISKMALLLAFVRYNWEGATHEDLLMCNELPTRTTGDECFRCLDGYFAQNGLDWKNCVGICTDGAASMTGKHSGVVRKILDRAPEATWVHCFLHRESLAAKEMSVPLNEVMDIAVKTINLVKNSALSSRLFSILCDQLESDHRQLLYHNEIRWLSRGNVLNRLFKMRKQVHTFLEEKRSPLAKHYREAEFLVKLAYMSDIFDQLNQLNLSFQGRNNGVFLMADKIEVFKRKLVFTDIQRIVRDHLTRLTQKFSDYFPNDRRVGNAWIRDPFSVDPSDVDVVLPINLQTQLVELASDGSLQLAFRKTDLSSFWIQTRHEYPELADRATKFLLPFSTTYLCESGFSTVTATKTKSRNRLTTASLCATLRVALSPIPPRLDIIISERQSQMFN